MAFDGELDLSQAELDDEGEDQDEADDKQAAEG